MSTIELSEEAAFDARFRDAARLIAEGRLAQATLLRRETSERRYRGVQIVVGEFELDDGRTIVYDHIFGPAFARHWRPGGVRRMLRHRATNEENADATPNRVAAVAVVDRLHVRRVRGHAAAGRGQGRVPGMAARVVVRAERAAP